MTEAELKNYFDLRPCTNKAQPFKIRNLIGEWQWANDHWSQLVGERLQTLYLSFHSIKTTTGLVAYSITLWKLKVIWGFVK